MESKREMDGKSKKAMEKRRGKVTTRFERCVIIYTYNLYSISLMYWCPS